MSTKKGNLSINSENIFPIIKKWLYSDHDIFVRELISNGVDAITKLKRLDSMGEAEIEDNPEYRITVTSSPKDKTLVFEDNGIGMTADEVEKYINQIAFSGAADFLEKYKDKDQSEQIIGHFGLGFYSAFMVADKVTIDTLSYEEGSKPVHWESDGGLTFEMSEGNKDTRGTTITLYLSDDSLEFSNEFRVKEVINKYCSFMPVEIYYVNEDKAKEEVKSEIEAEVKADEDELVGDAPKDEVKADADTKKDDEPKPLNDIHPLWTRTPADCKDEEYIDFYQHLFLDFKEPLFWIHLNMDYPFNLKGILYFPRLNPNMDKLEGTVKLYNNQVFVADNIKEVIPEFLLVLKGVIDCPDLPLNVSRSALQNDGFVAKISDYITKKVADKLIGMYKNNKEKYEGLWDDLSPFIKFGENQVFYISDAETQAKYIQMFKDEGIDAIYLTHNIDNPYITMMEARDDKVKFARIDSDVSATFKGEALSEEDEKKYTESLTEVFKKALNVEEIKLKVESLKDENISSMLTQSEADRRMAEMMKMYSEAGMGGMGMNFGQNSETLVLNSNNKLVKYVLDNPEGEITPTICCQLYDLAVLANKPLSADELTRFVARSNEILGKLI